MFVKHAPFAKIDHFGYAYHETIKSVVDGDEREKTLLIDFNQGAKLH